MTDETSEAPTAEETLLQLNNRLIELRADFRYILFSFEAVVDGVDLAAEQVQDKRLELLEKPPDVSLAEALLTTLLLFALEAGMVTRLAIAGAGEIAKSIKGVYGALFAMGKTKAFEATMTRLAGNIDWRAAKSTKSAAFADLERVVRKGLNRSTPADREAMENANLFLQMVGSRFEVTAATLKTARQKLLPNLGKSDPTTPQSPSARPFWPPELYGTTLPPDASGRPARRFVQQRFDVTQGADSPAVAFRGQWMSLYSDMQYLIEETLDQLQHALFTCSVSRSQTDMDSLLADLDILSKTAADWRNSLLSPHEARGEASYIYEMAIWALLYGDRLYVNPPGGLGWFGDPVDDDRLLLGVPQALVLYWWGRFIDPSTGGPFPNQVELYENIFASVGDALQRLDAGRNMTVTKG